MVKYEKVGESACVRAFITVFEHVLVARGYRREIKRTSPDEPDLMVYIKDSERISVILTAVSSDKTKVAVEGPAERLREVVRDTAELLMRELQDILALVS